MIFKNAKLMTKIFGMAAILLVLLAVTSSFSLFSINRFGNSLKGITEENIPLTRKVTSVALGQMEQAVYLQQAMRLGMAAEEGNARTNGFDQARKRFMEISRKVGNTLEDARTLVIAAMTENSAEQDNKHYLDLQERIEAIAAEQKGFETHVHHVFGMITKGQQEGVKEMADKAAVRADGLNRAVADLLTDVEQNTAERSTAANRLEPQAVLMILVVGFLALMIGLILSYLLFHSISRPITRVIASISGSSEHIATAATQVSGASQSLADEASLQAANVEETSSSLEEISSMISQNAEHADQANQATLEASQLADQGAQAMGRMSGAIEEIRTASGETAKIIKTIDEIAFQTNLLALNAAVEAARAGEAGRGFAVVAEEVRNLAQRSAEAARSTNSLIDSAVTKAEHGVRSAEEVGTVLEDLQKSINKVTALVQEVASATSQQAKGIAQVNSAMSQIDHSTQTTAGTAEQTAGASRQLSDEAASMERLVGELVAIVGHRWTGEGDGKRLNGGDGNGRTRVKGDKPPLRLGLEGALKPPDTPRVPPPGGLGKGKPANLRARIEAEGESVRSNPITEFQNLKEDDFEEIKP